MNSAPPEATRALLAFEAQGHHFVLDVMRVREIVATLPVIPTLDGPAWVMGHMVLREQMVVVLDLALALKRHLAPGEGGPHPVAPPGANGTAHKIVVVDVGTHTCGLWVDAVIEVAHVPLAELRVDRTPEGLRSPISFGLCELRGVQHRMLDVRPLMALSGSQSLHEIQEGS